MSVHFLKQRGIWYVKYWDPAAKKRRSKYFGSGKREERKARAFDLDIKSLKLTEGPLPVEPARVEGLYFDELAQEYLNHAKLNGASRRWLEEWAHTLNAFIVPILCQRPVDELSYADVLKVAEFYVDQRRASQATVNRYFGYLRAMFKYGLAKGRIAKNPLEGWKKPKEQTKQVALTVDDLRRIQQHSPPHLAWAIEVAYNLVLRVGVSELGRVKWEQVGWEKQEVYVWQTKTKRWKAVPCSPEFMAMLAEKRNEAQTEYLVEYQGQAPVKRLDRSWETAAKKAGIPYETTPYDVRHLAITEMLSRGEDPGAVADIAGHASAYYTITRYHHVRPAAKRKAIESLPALGAPSEVAEKKVVHLYPKKR